VVASINFPLGIGQFLAGHVGYAVQVKHMFSNFSWTGGNLTVAQHDIVKNWQTPWTGIYLHLVCVVAFNVSRKVECTSVAKPKLNGFGFEKFKKRRCW
jgi:hypothetical protein